MKKTKVKIDFPKRKEKGENSLNQPTCPLPPFFVLNFFSQVTDSIISGLLICWILLTSPLKNKQPSFCWWSSQTCVFVILCFFYHWPCHLSWPCLHLNCKMRSHLQTETVVIIQLVEGVLCAFLIHICYWIWNNPHRFSFPQIHQMFRSVLRFFWGLFENDSAAVPVFLSQVY